MTCEDNNRLETVAGATLPRTTVNWPTVIIHRIHELPAFRHGMFTQNSASGWNRCFSDQRTKNRLRHGTMSMMLAAPVALSKLNQLEVALNSAIRGKPEVVRLSLVCLLARGHLLIEDVPGVGKTTLAQAMARSVHCRFHRLQFTSDMLPSDVLGVTIYNAHAQEFEFKQGPVFTNFLLADEINRATPKTQSALLEAMNEQQVSVEGRTLTLPDPFMVIATQNPADHHGTYPLPESQLDRFLMRVRIGYPDLRNEREIIRQPEAHHGETTPQVLSREELLD